MTSWPLPMAAFALALSTGRQSTMRSTGAEVPRTLGDTAEISTTSSSLSPSSLPGVTGAPRPSSSKESANRRPAFVRDVAARRCIRLASSSAMTLSVKPAWGWLLRQIGAPDARLYHVSTGTRALDRQRAASANTASVSAAGTTRVDGYVGHNAYSAFVSVRRQRWSSSTPWRRNSARRSTSAPASGALGPEPSPALRNFLSATRRCCRFVSGFSEESAGGSDTASAASVGAVSTAASVRVAALAAAGRWNRSSRVRQRISDRYQWKSRFVAVRDVNSNFRKSRVTTQSASASVFEPGGGASTRTSRHVACGTKKGGSSEASGTKRSRCDVNRSAPRLRGALGDAEPDTSASDSSTISSRGAYRPGAKATKHAPWTADPGG